MSEATIKYNGTTIASVDGGGSVTLATQGKYMSGNVMVEAAEGGSGGGATEYVLQAAPLPIGIGYDFVGSGLTASDFDRNSSTKMWLEATATIQPYGWLDENQDDDFLITIPSGTIFECVSCQESQYFKTALFAFATGTTTAYGFIAVEYDKSENCVRVIAEGGNPSEGSAVQMPGFKKQNGGLPLNMELNLELHILKY